MAGILVNLALRLSILYFAIEVLLLPDDPRFAGKAIPARNAIIVVLAVLFFPALAFWGKVWKGYPVWYDTLFLSIFWLDMAGNSFNLYDTYFYFDVLPHFHGPGAVAALGFGAFGLSRLGALVILPGGEVGTLTAWWNAADGSEWRWQVEFYNHR